MRPKERERGEIRLNWHHHHSFLPPSPHLPLDYTRSNKIKAMQIRGAFSWIDL